MLQARPVLPIHSQVSWFLLLVHFCKQVEVYRTVLNSKRLSSLFHGRAGSSPEGVLPAITLLRKLCNHPQLLLSQTAATACGEDPPQQQGQEQQTLANVAGTAVHQHLGTSDVPIDTIDLSGAGSHAAADCFSQSCLWHSCSISRLQCDGLTFILSLPLHQLQVGNQRQTQHFNL